MKKEDKQQEEDNLMVIKIFWRNFLTVIGIFLGVTLMFAYIPGEDGERAMGLTFAYFFTSAFCVLSLGVKIAEKYTEEEKVQQKRNKFLKQEGMDIQEFRKKYRDVINIYSSLNISEVDDVNNFSVTNSISDVLTDKQIINFLQCIENTDKNISLEDFFEKDEDGYGYGYFLKALHIEGEDKYIVNFGDSGPGGGTGGLYTIYIDEEDNITMEDKSSICHWDN